MRALGLVAVYLAFASPARAADEAQVDWVGDWKRAFRQAKESNKPVMVCINSRDGEQANERAAHSIYHDPWFVPLSRRFVMIVVSVHVHAENGICPRFGKVTCQEHVNCWSALRLEHGDTFLVPNTTNEMISPQHAWFGPDGKLLQRKEYELSRAELLKRMRAVLAGCGPGGGADRPLDDRDREALERVRHGDEKARWAALGWLFASEKTAVKAAVAGLLKKITDTTQRCELLRAFGRAKALDVRPSVERLLKDRDAEVRSFAAVCLEEMGSVEAVGALAKRARTESEAIVRKNLYRALGACGGPAGDKAAARALLKAVGTDKDSMVCKHAALALRCFESAGDLVRKKLEQLALRVKDQDVRLAVAYALAYVGNPKTSVHALEKLAEKMHDEWREKFVQSAIDKLQGGEKPLSAGWLYGDDRNDPARKR